MKWSAACVRRPATAVQRKPAAHGDGLAVAVRLTKAFLLLRAKKLSFALRRTCDGATSSASANLSLVLWVMWQVHDEASWTREVFHEQLHAWADGLEPYVKLGISSNERARASGFYCRFYCLSRSPGTCSWRGVGSYTTETRSLTVKSTDNDKHGDSSRQVV